MNRFFTFWWALGVVFVFGLLVFLVAGTGSARPAGDVAFDAARAAKRSEALVGVRAAQAKLLSGAGEAVEGSEGLIRVPVEVAAKLLVAEAGRGVPRVTAVPVPGTPAAMELMKKQAAEAEALKAKEDAKKKEEDSKAKEDSKTGGADAGGAAKPAPKAGAAKAGAPKGGAKKSAPVKTKPVDTKPPKEPAAGGPKDR